MNKRASMSESWPLPAPGPNRTGGAVWHARALAARARWQPTRQAIAAWLDKLAFESSELVLVGASAGWMMSSAFLSRFKAVAAIDIDPIARPLFALRHGLALRASGVRVSWHAFDALGQLEQLLERWPSAAILFDNVLGQQIYRSHDLDRLERALSGLAQSLSGRQWASLHDWLSGPANPPDPRAVFAGEMPRVRVDVSGVRSLSSGWPAAPPLSADSWEALGPSLLAWLHAHGEWQDHRSAGIFPVGTEVCLIPWEFRMGKWHWLQAGHVNG